MWRLLLVVAGCGRFDFDPLGLRGDGGSTQPDGDGRGTAASCAPANELVACWDFEGTVTDGSGTGNDLVATNIGYASGASGLGVRVDASSDLEIADNASFAATSARSFEAWFLPSSVPALGVRAGILDKSSEVGMFIFPDGTITCVFAIGGSNFPVSTGLVPAVGASHHVGCVYDGTTIVAYIDGAVVAMLAQPGAPEHAGTPLVIGHNEPTGEPFDGVIDSVRIWNRALGANEICSDAGSC